MQSVRFVGTPLARRRILAENLLQAAQHSRLELQNNGSWIQLRDTQGPQVLLSVHAEERHSHALDCVHDLMKKLDVLSEEQNPSMESLLPGLDKFLNAHPHHTIQL